MEFLLRHHDETPVEPSAPPKNSDDCSFHLDRHPHLKDSVEVQTSRAHNYVNDSEQHEEHPHLQDFLKPHHTRHVHLAVNEKEEDESKEDEDSTTSATADDSATFLQSIPCPHKTIHIDPTKKVKDPSSPLREKKKDRPSLPRPQTSSLRTPDCQSRKPCPETEERRTIQFTTVTLRDYGMILGDHPECRFGLPVTLGWDYLEYEPLSVDDYEIHHALRRPLQQMRLPSERRHEMFLDLRYKTAELNQARKELIKTQNGRLWTRTLLDNPLLHHVDGGLRFIARRVKRKVPPKQQQ